MSSASCPFDADPSTSKSFCVASSNDSDSRNMAWSSARTIRILGTLDSDIRYPLDAQRVIGVGAPEVLCRELLPAGYERSGHAEWQGISRAMIPSKWPFFGAWVPFDDRRRTESTRRRCPPAEDRVRRFLRRRREKTSYRPGMASAVAHEKVQRRPPLVFRPTLQIQHRAAKVCRLQL